MAKQRYFRDVKDCAHTFDTSDLMKIADESSSTFQTKFKISHGMTKSIIIVERARRSGGPNLMTDSQYKLAITGQDLKHVKKKHSNVKQSVSLSLSLSLLDHHSCKPGSPCLRRSRWRRQKKSFLPYIQLSLLFHVSLSLFDLRLDELMIFFFVRANLLLVILSSPFTSPAVSATSSKYNICVVCSS